MPNTKQVAELVKGSDKELHDYQTQALKELSIKPSFLSFSSSQQYRPIPHMVVLHQSEKQKKCLEKAIISPSISYLNLPNESRTHKLHTMSRSQISMEGSSIKPTAMKFPASIKNKKI